MSKDKQFRRADRAVIRDYVIERLMNAAMDWRDNRVDR
jgi:hypothetical protein